MKFNSKMLTLYGITDKHFVGRYTLAQQVEMAVRGGAAIIQLREKDISHSDLVAKAKELLPICRKYGVPLIINDDYTAALESGADGVHVGIEDTKVEEIRKNVPTHFIIGATATTVEQAQSAQKQGADYLGVGAVFPSPTKTNAVRITGEQLQEIVRSVKLPCVGIGGITYENADELKGTGIKGIAVVSAIFGAEDIEKAAHKLREKAEEIIKS